MQDAQKCFKDNIIQNVNAFYGKVRRKAQGDITKNFTGNPLVNAN